MSGYGLGMTNESTNVGEDASATPKRIEDVSCPVDHADAIAEAIAGQLGAVHNLNDGILLKVASYGLNQNGTRKARGPIDDEIG